MRNFFNVMLTVPFLGLMSIYFYILSTMILINSMTFHNFDPKNTPISFLYTPITMFTIVASFIFIPLGFIILLLDYIKFEGKLISISFKWIYFIGVVLTIFLHYFDLGYCQIWFFD